MVWITILAAFGLPVAMAAALAVPAMRAAIWRLMPLAALPALALAVMVPVPVAVSAPWLILGAEFGLDATARLFLGFTAALWTAAAVAARHWMRDDRHATGFGLGFLLTMAGNLGLILAEDALSFYAFFALMSFSSYGLVIHARKAAALSAGRLYIAFVIAGELVLFAGLVLAVSEAGSWQMADLRAAVLSDLAAALLIAGLAVKLGIMPLHFWLPPAHGAAPVPASAVLSGAMIKAGLYGMVALLPLGAQALPEHGTVLTAAGLVTIFAALLLGLREDSPKAVLGFSSVSQMGIVALGLGAALLEPRAWPVLLPVLAFLAAHHALSKGALFLGVGVFGAFDGKAARLAVLAGLAVPALVLAGAPLSSGGVGKEALKAALAEGSRDWLPWLLVALALSGMVTTLLLARFAVTLWRSAPPAPMAADPVGLTLPFAALAALALALPWLWPYFAGADAAPILDAKPGDAWPLMAGVAIALAAMIRAHALALGPTAFLAQIAAPAVWVQLRITRALAHKRRTARRLWHALPTGLAMHAERLRLGQTAVAALLIAVFAVEAASTLLDDPPPPVGEDLTLPEPFPLPDLSDP